MATKKKRTAAKPHKGAASTAPAKAAVTPSAPAVSPEERAQLVGPLDLDAETVASGGPHGLSPEARKAWLEDYARRVKLNEELSAAATDRKPVGES